MKDSVITDTQTIESTNIQLDAPGIDIDITNVSIETNEDIMELDDSFLNMMDGFNTINPENLEVTKDEDVEDEEVAEEEPVIEDTTTPENLDGTKDENVDKEPVSDAVQISFDHESFETEPVIEDTTTPENLDVTKDENVIDEEPVTDDMLLNLVETFKSGECNISEPEPIQVFKSEYGMDRDVIKDSTIVHEKLVEEFTIQCTDNNGKITETLKDISNELYDEEKSSDIDYDVEDDFDFNKWHSEVSKEEGLDDECITMEPNIYTHCPLIPLELDDETEEAEPEIESVTVIHSEETVTKKSTEIVDFDPDADWDAIYNANLEEVSMKAKPKSFN